MPNQWIEHVKNYAHQHQMTYGCALSEPGCKASYQRPEKKRSNRKGAAANTAAYEQPDFGVGPEEYEDDSEPMHLALQDAVASVKKIIRKRKPKTPNPPTPSPRKKSLPSLLDDYDVQIPKKTKKKGVASREALDNFKASHHGMTPSQWNAFQKKYNDIDSKFPSKAKTPGDVTPKSKRRWDDEGGGVRSDSYLQPSRLQYFTSDDNSSSDDEY